MSRPGEGGVSSWPILQVRGLIPLNQTAQPEASTPAPRALGALAFVRLYSAAQREGTADSREPEPQPAGRSARRAHLIPAESIPI